MTLTGPLSSVNNVRRYFDRPSLSAILGDADVEREGFKSPVESLDRGLTGERERLFESNQHKKDHVVTIKIKLQ